MILLKFLNISISISQYNSYLWFFSFCLFCREVVIDLIEEYKAAERMDYVTWGGSSHNTPQTQPQGQSQSQATTSASSV